MGLFDFFRRDKQPQRRNKNFHQAVRSAYLMGQISNLYADWPTQGGTADQEIYSHLRPMRTRSRHLKKNNDYAKRFSGLLKTNVIGAQGIKMQVRSRKENGELDEADNNYIEAGFGEWSKKGVCTADGRLSLIDAEKLFIDTVAFDGECIVRKIKGWPHNRFGFAIQFLETSTLDHELNKVLQNGNVIRLGVEFDEWRRPVNYYFKTPKDPVTIFGENIGIYGSHQVIPAGEIIHEFIADRINQSRGVPWLHTAGRRLHMIAGYEEGELVASRASANKMGFLTSKTGDEYVGEDDDDDETTPAIMDGKPGTIEELPEGMSFEAWDPTHPTTAFESFILAVLRGAASGLNVSYVSLANDLRGVSYSSIRQGVLGERDEWRALQGWMIEHFMQGIYEEWLSMSILTGALRLPMRKFNKFNSVIWRGRRWQWVDPLKEIKAYKEAIRAGLTPPQDIIAEMGGDFSETIELIKEAVSAVQGLPLDLFSPPKPEKTEVVTNEE